MISLADHLRSRFLQDVMGALQGIATEHQADEALHTYLETSIPTPTTPIFNGVGSFPSPHHTGRS